MRRHSATIQEILLPVMVFCLAGICAWWFLASPNVSIQADWGANCTSLGPSLSWAAGHGMLGGVPDAPEVEEFLFQKRPSISLADVPRNPESRPINGKFELDRIYILYAVGMAWRLFGASWIVVEGLLALVFAISGLVIYAIFRLGMNRWFSLAGVMLSLSSPVMLAQLPSMRSLFKAPFILAALLILGYLISREVRPRTLHLLALLFGCITGIGFGCRQDVLIVLPPAIALMALGPGLSVRPPARTRLIAIVLLLAGFFIPAWPSIRMTFGTGGNNAFYLTQGFALPSVRAADMERGAACALCSNSDHDVNAFITDYYQRQDAVPRNEFSNLRATAALHAFTALQANPALVAPDAVLGRLFLNQDQIDLWSPKAERAARRLVASLCTTFPADFVGRTCAATIRILRNLQPKDGAQVDSAAFHVAQRFQEPLAAHLTRYGVIYAGLAFLLLSARSIRLALTALLLLLYFTGYTSLEFQVRHAFHLNFLSFWFPCFLAGSVFTVLSRVRSAGRAGLLAALGSRACWWPWPGRVAVFVAVAALGFSAPLWLTRAVQQKTVGGVLDACAHADLEPVPILESHDVPTGRFHTVGRLPGFEQPVLDSILSEVNRSLMLWPEPVVQAEYLVAEMECTTGSPSLRWEYETPIPMDFAKQGFDYYNLPAGGTGTIRFFFPVFKYSEQYLDRHPADCDLGAFKGILTPENVELKALYRVRNLADFPYLMNVWLPADPAQIRWYQEFTWW